MKKSIPPSILLIGITAIISQIVLIRELIIVFYGNEISIGFILANWLLLGAIGSIFLGRLADQLKNKIKIFSGCQLFLSIALFLSLILIRMVKKILAIAPGEIVGFELMLVSSFIILAPICITLGFLFALSCKVYDFRDPAQQIGRVYILEAMGSALGGIICSCFLIKYLSSMEILAGLSLLNISAFLFLSKDVYGSFLGKLLRVFLFSFLIICMASLLRGDFRRLDQTLQAAAWKPIELISSRNSIYGNTTVTRSGEQISFFTNGLHNFTVPDELSQEESVHFAMLEHPDPKDILIIGGGQGGLIWEILKYPVRRIDYIELDPLIIQMGNLYLSKMRYFIKENPKVNIIHTDGRLWVKNTGQKYDVVIMSLSNPFTAQLNRFYTLEFFKELRSIMSDNAILSFGVTSSENYISNELGMFLGSINNTLKAVFADVKVMPGNTAYFLASDKKNALNIDYRFLTERLKQKNIDVKFIKDYYLFSALSPERLDYISHSLKKNYSSPINYDFKPISYYYDTVLWSTCFSSPLKKILPLVTEFKIWIILGIICAGLFITHAVVKKKIKRLAYSAILAIGTTGFSEIAFEVSTILAFQIIYGFIYYKLGLMLTSFMVGLVLGSYYITDKLDRITDMFGTFLKIQFGIVLYPLVLPPVFLFLAKQTGGITYWLGSNIIFPLLPAVAGFIGGLQFPVGAKLYLDPDDKIARTGGMIYGIDLMGACLGAVVVSSFLIPIMGLPKTCVLICLLNLAIFAFLLTVQKDILDKTYKK